ncbi:hypothetical protein PN47_19305, partial [Vibrio anguillarum]
SVLILSSTKAIATGFDMLAATAAAINDSPIPNFDSPFGFPSIEHFTFSPLLMDGNPRIVEVRDTDPLCTRAARATEEVVVQAVMVAISVLLRENDHNFNFFVD